MNLKDAILSTITEIQNQEELPVESTKLESKPQKPFSINEERPSKVSHRNTLPASSHIIEDQFLKDLRERILVLFEGFQSPNNANIEAKVDLTLNFLEHLLAKIDKKMEGKES